MTEPRVLFCDEPTSGLDSYSTMTVVKTLRGVAERGRIVICSIHQPASGILDLFPEVLLLFAGRVAFQGSCADATAFFDRYQIVKLTNFIFFECRTNYEIDFNFY